MCRLVLLVLLSATSPQPASSGGGSKRQRPPLDVGWTEWRKNRGVRQQDAVLTLRGVEYWPHDRVVKVRREPGCNWTCPDFDPRKLPPNDPLGSRAIGGLHNKLDPILRTLHHCEMSAQWPSRKDVCVARPSLDLFVWQPDHGFYTHGSTSLFTWLHDFVAPLLHAVAISGSAASAPPAERALVVLHHTARHHHPTEPVKALAGGRRLLLKGVFGAGVYTLGFATTGSNSAAGAKAAAAESMMPREHCMTLRRLVIGHGSALSSQEARFKRLSVALLREAGFRAAGLPGPPAPLELTKRPPRALHILAPHQHAQLQEYSRQRTDQKNSSGQPNRLLLGLGSEAADAALGSSAGAGPAAGNIFMFGRFRALEAAMAERLVGWGACCELTAAAESSPGARKAQAAGGALDSQGGRKEQPPGDRTTTAAALVEAIRKASEASVIVGTNTPAIIYCLWAPRGAITVEFSPKGPHDRVLMWNLCGWATNGSYVKISVPRPMTPPTADAGKTGLDDDGPSAVKVSGGVGGVFSSRAEESRSRGVAFRTTECVAALLASTRFPKSKELRARAELEACKVVAPPEPAVDSPNALCPGGFVYERNGGTGGGRGERVGDVCQRSAEGSEGSEVGKDGKGGGQVEARDADLFAADIFAGSAPAGQRFICPRHCSATAAAPFCVAGGALNRPEVAPSPEVPGGYPCRAWAAVRDEFLGSAEGILVAAALWNPDLAMPGASATPARPAAEPRGAGGGAGTKAAGASPRDRLEPLWHNGHAKAVPAAPRDPKRRGAFDFSKLGGSGSSKMGCHTTLKKSREHNRIWCPKGAGLATAG